MDQLWTSSLSRPPRAFFALLHSGLWGTQPDTSAFPLTSAEWAWVYDTACRHTVQGVLYEGVQRLPAAHVPPQPLVISWTAATLHIEQAYRLSCRVAAHTHARLSDAGLHPVLQKGLAVGAFYMRPERRVSGDTDWYIPDAGAFGRLPQLLQAQGIEAQRRPDHSYLFQCEGTEVELHSHLIDILHPARQQVIAALLQAEPSQLRPLADGTAVRQPGPLATLVMLCAHLFKHACTTGVGLRQFCDMARAYHALHGQYDPEQLTAILRQLGLGSWSPLLHTCLTAHLGLSPTCLPHPFGTTASASSRKLMAQVLRWGNFGQAATTHEGMWHTAALIARRLPFSLHHAPAETCFQLGRLVLGRVKGANERGKSKQR